MGANTGVYSLVASATLPSRNVYATEAHPLFCEMLRDNLVINHNFSNLRVFEVAFSDYDGIAEVDDYATGRSAINVESITLDSFCSKSRIENIDLIKVDIEGMEPCFLRGGLRVIRKNTPIIFIEVLTVEAGMEIETLLMDLKYQFYAISEFEGPRLRRVSSLRPHTKLGRNYFLVSDLMSSEKRSLVEHVLKRGLGN